MRYEIGAGFGLLGLSFLILACVLIILAHPNGQVNPTTLIGPSGASGISGTTVNAQVQGFFASTTTAHTISTSDFIVLSGQTDTFTGNVSSTMQSQHYLVPYDLTFGSLSARGEFTNGTGSDVIVTAQVYRADITVTGTGTAIGDAVQFTVPSSSTTGFGSQTVDAAIPVSVTRGERLAIVVSSNGDVTVNALVGSASWAQVL